MISPRADFGRPRWRKLSGAAGLAGLTAVTSWVVSSISVWLVPVYIGAMVLIFAFPRTNDPNPAREDESGEPMPDEQPPASSSVESKEPAKVDAPSPTPSPAAEAATPTEAAPPKPRKRRVRAKKTAKGATALDDSFTAGRVTWVRVGPGKFVRSVIPVAEFVGPPAPASIAEPQTQVQPPAETRTETNAPTDAVPDTGAVAVEAEVEVQVEVGSADETGSGERDVSPVPVPVVESPQPPSESPSMPDDPPSAREFGPGEQPCQEPLMDQDDSARVEGAPEGTAPSELVETADVEAAGFAIEHEHESESTCPDVSEAIAEEHGNAPSTLGEGSGIVLDPEAGHDEEPSSVVASLPAVEVVVDVEVDRRELGGMWAPERFSPVGLADSPTMEAPGRRARLGLFFSASLRRPRRTAEPAAAVSSRRLGNVRRPGAARRATLAGRAVETRVRQFVDDVRGRRANVKRDFHPRSPPARS